jgi:hypothetical protein
MEEFEGVCDPDGSGISDSFDTTVVVESGSKVPCSYCMVPTGLSLGWLDVNHDFCTNWCHWSSVEGEHAF